MAELTEEIVDREIRISLYLDGTFASAERRNRVQVLRDGQAVGAPEWHSEKVEKPEELQAFLGETAVTHAANVKALSDAHIEKRNAWMAEKEQMQAQHAATVAELQALLAERDAKLAEIRKFTEG